MKIKIALKDLLVLKQNREKKEPTFFGGKAYEQLTNTQKTIVFLQKCSEKEGFFVEETTQFEFWTQEYFQKIGLIVERGLDYFITNSGRDLLEILERKLSGDIGTRY